MIHEETLQSPVRPGHLFGVLLAAGGGALWWLDRFEAGSLPAWAPYDFDWTYYLATALALWWYGRGLWLASPAERPAAWRPVLYFLGVGVIYAVLQTRFEYMAQHMFFLNRVQHLVMHHLGPFLIALAWPGETLARGMPAPLRRLVAARPLLAVVKVLQQPFVAALLFVGLIALWLTPSIHFVAMIDRDLYRFMNWTMVADGVLFWLLVLDPRPWPPATAPHAVRILLAVLVMFPQIVIGAMITFATHDIYEFYDWCGRLYPSIGAMDDQIYGGLIVWIPAAMMSVIGMLCAINALRISEESKDDEIRGDEADDVISSAGWTGR